MPMMSVARSGGREMELWEHLAELRGRLIRCGIYLALGSVGAWCFVERILAAVWLPIQPVFDAHPGWTTVIEDVTRAFSLKLQLSVVTGMMLASPLVTLELWGFIAPGLTANERRACALVFPLSILLFAAGAVCGYLMITPTTLWFAGHVPDGWGVMLTPEPYLALAVRLVLGGALAFQMPVVAGLMAYLGLVSARMLREQWRFALVGCLVVGAITTPGGDPMMMLFMTAPVAVLYLVSIALCTGVERFRDRRR
jgi:sec-independent protein translocase protein TatC